MSQFRTQQELDIKLGWLATLDNDALINAVCETFLAAQEARRHMSDGTNDLFESYRLARSELDRRLR